jgi:hypothetical protein
MQTYSCLVGLRSGELEGPVLTEVSKEVSAAEIAVLRHLHGEDAVTAVAPLTMDRRPHGAERERLALLYGQAVVDRLFPPGSRLPVKVAAAAPEPAGEDEEEDAPGRPAAA